MVRQNLWKRGEAIKIGTWNVYSLRGLGRSNLLGRELCRVGVTLCGATLCGETEMHLSGARLTVLEENSNFKLLFSGLSSKISKGVGLVFPSSAENSIKPFNLFLNGS